MSMIVNISQQSLAQKNKELMKQKKELLLMNKTEVEKLQKEKVGNIKGNPYLLLRSNKKKYLVYDMQGKYLLHVISSFSQSIKSYPLPLALLITFDYSITWLIKLNNKIAVLNLCHAIGNSLG